MKVLLPEHIGDITLGQFQRYSKLLENESLVDKAVALFNKDKQNKKKIEIFTGIPFRSIDDISQKDKEDILKQIDTALDLSPEFTNRFDLNGVEMGFIPNFDKITSGEFTDINLYQNDVDKLHNLMAILFRPVDKIDAFKNYSIVEYNGTSQYAEMMKQMPLSHVNGALSFFLNLSNELEDYTQQFIMEAQLRAAKH